jgi:HK97 family phage major capsid protein
MMSTFKTLIAEARSLVLEGKLDEAEAKKNQAAALKALDDLEPTVNPADRLPFPASPAPEAPAESATDIAVKSWYVRQYGDGSTAMDQVMSELYGRDHRKFAWAKSADFVRYVRTGQYDPQLHRAMVYSPAQVETMLQLGMSVAELKATQIESQDTLGGFLVPEDFRDRMVQRLQGLTAMRKVADVMTTTRDRVTMPVATGGDDRYTGAVRVYKVDESPTSDQAATNATFGQVTIPVHTMMGHVAVSKNLTEDAQGALSILPYLEAQFASAFAIFEDEQYLVGNGVAGPQGILKDATTGGPYTYAYGSVATVNSGNATALTGDAFRNMPYAIASQYRMMGGQWIAARGTLRVVKTLKAGDGTYLWSGRGDTPQLQQGQPPALEGFPIGESEVLASPTSASVVTYTANVYPVVFVTKGSYLIVDRIGMDVTRYDDSTTGKTNTIVLVARKRGGGQLINPWGAAVMKVSA